MTQPRPPRPPKPSAEEAAHIEAKYRLLECLLDRYSASRGRVQWAGPPTDDEEVMVLYNEWLVEMNISAEQHLRTI